jgi:hypothetical protein
VTVDTWEVTTVTVPAAVWVMMTVLPSALTLSVSADVLVNVTTTVVAVDGVNVSISVELKTSVVSGVGSETVAVKPVLVVEL